MQPQPPEDVLIIARTLEKAGHETWAVGGAVRDALLDRPADWDLATHARPTEVRRLFRRTVPIGIEHGTVGVLATDGTLYEVTTFRRDVETDGRHAVVHFAETIEEDLARRDFTINAVAWHPLREQILDPFSGLEDLRARILRTVGVPEERFREDYLRILRGLRFAGLFGLSVEAPTWQALRDAAGHLTSLSAERIRDELLKVLDADPDPRRALELYAESGALKVLYPEWEAVRAADAAAPDGMGGGSWELVVETARQLPKGRPLQRLVALASCLVPSDAAALLSRLRLSNAQTDETAWRAKAPPLPDPDAAAAAFRRWLSSAGAARLSAVARVEVARATAAKEMGRGGNPDAVVRSWKRARHVRDSSPPLELGDLAIDGRALVGLGLQPGPQFGRILDALLDWVLEDPARNRSDLLSERALELAGVVAGE